MALQCLPPIEQRRWPTLGPELCDWIEANLVYGPGPLAGEPYIIEPEFRAELYRMYEVFPRGHARATRRRFKRVATEKRKGTAKSEKAAIIAAAESHPDAPVRCDGFRREGKVWVPVGRGVPSHPYIPMMAYTEEQSEDLAYAVLRYILSNSEVAADYDIGLDRVLVLDRFGREAGKVQALAGSPSARDGARTTHQHFDETHRLVLPRHRHAHETMLQNAFKLREADAWSHETTTPGESNEHSIARDTNEYAQEIAAGRSRDSSLCFIRRFCPDEWPLRTRDEVMAALVEASGPASEWSADLDALVDAWFQPKTDKRYYRRVWLAQWGQGGGRAFDLAKWKRLGSPETVPPKSFITLGFDGARTRDTTALVGTEIETGYQWLIGLWKRPDNWPEDQPWEIESHVVDAVVAWAFETWEVWRLYADPPHWDEWVESWAGRFGSTRVVKWQTYRPRPMATALRRYWQAIEEGTLAHDANPEMAEHIGNAVRRNLQMNDDEGQPLWVIEKERPDSPLKIDAAMAGCLSWDARLDALAAGAQPEPVHRWGGF